MNPRFHPGEAVIRYEFSGDDCLYRDVFGRRVVADVDGFGTACVQNANCLLSAICDDVEMPGFQWTYTRFLTVLALEPGEVSVFIRQGRSTVTGNTEVVPLPYHGCGWLVETRDSVLVDRRYSTADVVQPEPFFLGLTGQGKTTIIAATSKARLLDSLHVADPAELGARSFSVQNISKVSELSSIDALGDQHTGLVASHLNRATWSLVVPPDVRGLVIRKHYDRFHGRQRARVLIDGAPVGWWYEPRQDRLRRWGVSDFGIADIRPGLIEIGIDPPPGTPLWSFSRYEIFGISDV